MTRAVAWSVTLGDQVAEPFSVTATLGTSAPFEMGHAEVSPECRDRVRAALLNSGQRWPQARVRFSIPAAPQPCGIADLAVAVALVAAAGDLRSSLLSEIMFVAELGLDGSLRPVEGTWAAFDAAPLLGITHAVVPQALLPEFGPSTAITVVGASTLAAVLAWLRGTHYLPCAGTHRWNL
ncbi:magnesium chelatase domain-containing protein [Nocardia brasiliensis]|uniref:magnesium chelatase domain-containing protein n=1 Tax=Nocardia brasiliensis TaxID=37326 RepID=UPI002456D4E6|nr:magnesium chelatase domain-containing protein [Nocardia brasiliensis]